MKREIKNIYALGFTLLIVFLTGCYKDKGNYDLHEINKVSILKNGSDTVQINQFGQLKVETTLAQTLVGDEANLSYKWSVFLFSSPITGVVDEVLAETKDLDVQFGLRPETYTLLYTVTDNSTGVSYFKKYLLQVSSTLSEGWLLISEEASGARDIDLLHPNGSTINNLLSTANPGESIPSGLHTVRVLTTFFGSSQNIFILGETAGMRLKYTDFTKVNVATDWFVEKNINMKPQEYSYDRLGSNAFYIDNGKIYSNQVDFRYGAALSGDYELSKYFLPAQSSDAAIVYDQKNKKFLNYSGKKFSTFSSAGNAGFDMNDVGMDVLFGGTAPSSQYSYLMKDSQQRPYVLRISNGGSVGKYPVDQATNVLQASAAAFSGLYFHMYYSVGNEIYLLDIANNSAKLLYTMPAGESISALSLKQSLSSFVGYPDNNRVLAVGTYNGTEGKVYTFGIDNVGEISNGSYTAVYENLDKPISLTYKNRK